MPEYRIWFTTHEVRVANVYAESVHEARTLADDLDWSFEELEYITEEWDIEELDCE